MKKLLIFLVLICTSCLRELNPIEKYKGYVIVVIYENKPTDNTTSILLKCESEIITARVLDFDLIDKKVGDTIK